MIDEGFAIYRSQFESLVKLGDCLIVFHFSKKHFTDSSKCFGFSFIGEFGSAASKNGLIKFSRFFALTHQFAKMSHLQNNGSFLVRRGLGDGALVKLKRTFTVVQALVA